ncbi:proline-rich proteoglycan 2-like, partial [Penaeus monodon]|uniref:proline-rich proteoglycan 2-like n=1 Tax=Penaeus monodon TaxID=6687 RepID=UPI0018A763F7
MGSFEVDPPKGAPTAHGGPQNSALPPLGHSPGTTLKSPKNNVKSRPGGNCLSQMREFKTLEGRIQQGRVFPKPLPRESTPAPKPQGITQGLPVGLLGGGAKRQGPPPLSHPELVWGPGGPPRPGGHSSVPLGPPAAPRSPTFSLDCKGPVSPGGQRSRAPFSGTQHRRGVYSKDWMFQAPCPGKTCLRFKPQVVTPGDATLPPLQTPPNKGGLG